jgi:hypothetical protein
VGTAAAAGRGDLVQSSSHGSSAFRAQRAHRVERDLHDLRRLIDQLDEELIQTHDPEREDFLVTVFKSEELGFYSDEFESDDDEDDEP